MELLIAMIEYFDIVYNDCEVANIKSNKINIYWEKVKHGSLQNEGFKNM